MKKIIIAIITALLIVCSIFADVNVESTNHIQNTEKGLCAWASLETLGRTHGWDEIKGLTSSKNGPPYHREIPPALDHLKVKYRTYQGTETEWWYILWFQEKGKPAVVLGAYRNDKEAQKVIKDTPKAGDYWIEKKYYWKSDFVWKAVDEGLGAAVSFDAPGRVRHMMCIVGWDQKEVRCIDSNYKPGTIRKVPLHEFISWWNGFAIVIEKKK